MKVGFFILLPMANAPLQSGKIQKYVKMGIKLPLQNWFGGKSANAAKWTIPKNFPRGTMGLGTNYPDKKGSSFLRKFVIKTRT